MIIFSAPQFAAGPLDQLDDIPDEKLYGRLYARTENVKLLSICGSGCVIAGRWVVIILFRWFPPAYFVNPYALTMGFRRFATYKRANLIISDVERLLRIINRPNMPVQIIFAGKAHPADEPGKRIIQQVYRQVKKRAEMADASSFLEDYDINLARYLVQGVDVWIKYFHRLRMEASGTSGMKAAINGALNFSVLDGWWREAYNGENGWAERGEDVEGDNSPVQDQKDAEDLYGILENLPALFRTRDPKEISHSSTPMKGSLNFPQFRTRRMVEIWRGCNQALK